MTESQIKKAKELIEEFQAILPDHLGAMELPIAKMCARLTVQKIMDSNPNFTIFGLEPQTGSLEFWKGVLEYINQ